VNEAAGREDGAPIAVGDLLRGDDVGEEEVGVDEDPDGDAEQRAEQPAGEEDDDRSEHGPYLHRCLRLPKKVAAGAGPAASSGREAGPI